MQSNRVTDVALIGTGAFGRSFLAQSSLIPGIKVTAVCDQDIELAKAVCLQTGLAPEDLKVCHTESEANDAIANGRTAVVSDAGLLPDLPIEVLIEASGMPGAGAIHARAAIDSGKHVVMVTKETDCVVGPILNRLAQNAGTVYTPADGDQPSLLIGLISWAETLGFEIVCAGKAAELDFIFDPESKAIARGNQTVSVAEENLWDLPNGAAEHGIGLRRRAFESLQQFSAADLCELAIVINSTGYDYDAPQLQAPVARIIEMPEMMCGRNRGGIFQKEGVIDMVNCLRRADEVSFAGGVFVIVTCRERETWQLLKDKGHLVDRAGTRAMIFRPCHLLGVETSISVLAASRLKLSTGETNINPLVDVGIRASRTLAPGEQLTLRPDHSIPGVLPEIMPAGKMASDSPLPYYLAAGNRLNRAVEAGRLLTCGMIDYDPQSCLWKLRREQDEVFF